jgi:hypothetical protein
MLIVIRENAIVPNKEIADTLLGSQKLIRLQLLEYRIRTSEYPGVLVYYLIVSSRSRPCVPRELKNPLLPDWVLSQYKKDHLTRPFFVFFAADILS